MAEENKPVVGQEFFQRFGRSLQGQNPNPSADKAKSGAEKYKEKTEELEAQDNYLQTKDRIENPPSVKEVQQKREADLEQRAAEAEQRAREADDKIRNASEEARREAEQAAAQARQEADAAKDALHNHQLQMLTDKMDELSKSKRPMAEQMNEYFAFADEMAAKMGWVKPGALAPASDNPQISLEIARLQIEDARAQREHERQMDRDKREWDLKIMELNDKRDVEKAKLAQQEKRDNMIFTAPQAIGGAIAQGLIDHTKGKGTQQPVSQQATQRAPQTQQKGYKIQAAQGESNEFACPGCNEPVAFGPTSNNAVCVNCGSEFKIERGEPQPPEEG
jgi:hypothetical protein